MAISGLTLRVAAVAADLEQQSVFATSQPEEVTFQQTLRDIAAWVVACGN